MLTLFNKINEKSNKDPFALAIINPDFHINYQDLKTLIQHCLALMNSHNIQHGDRVGLLFNKPINHFIASLACLYRGCTQVPFHKNCSLSHLKDFSEITRCQFFFSDHAIENISGKLISFSIAQAQHTNNIPLQTPAIFSEQLAILIIGSGTSANSKIIPVTFKALDEQIKRDIKAHQLKENERFLALSPISYYTSLRRMFACLEASACAAFIDTQKNNLITFCNQVKIDHLSLIAGHVQHLLIPLENLDNPHIKLPYLKTLFIGASPISKKIRTFLQNEISANVFIFYGPNEIGAATCVHLHNTGNKDETIGLPIDGIKLEIVNTHNKICAIGEVGRIRMQSASLCGRYEEHGHELSNESFIDGWFYPKDLAYRDEDGHIIFQGREDDLIIYYGHNIYPRHIEHVLEQHAYVKEAAAFGILDKNGEQIPVAIISLNENLSLAHDDLIQELKNFCKEQLDLSSPSIINIEENFPKNAAGKILKRELKEKYQQLKL